MRRLVASFIAIIALCFGIALASVSGDSSRTAPAHSTHAPTTSTLDPARVEAVHEYVVALERQQVGDYIRAQTVAELGAFLASIPAPPVAVEPALSPAPASGATSGGAQGACGGATNGADQFIARESGGNPNVWNTGGSGAWGCYQIMPGTWAGAGCNELGAHGSASPAAQAACASRLSLSAWNL